MNNQEEDPSKYYKLGLFYFNKNDKRIFPPKRNPVLGWTVNFANPYSILAFLALLAAIYIVGQLIGKM